MAQDRLQAWIREGRDVRRVLEHLPAANFDPELHAQHESRLVAAYNRRHPEDPVRLRARRGLRGMLRALGPS